MRKNVSQSWQGKFALIVNTSDEFALFRSYLIEAASKFLTEKNVPVGDKRMHKLAYNWLHAARIHFILMWRQKSSSLVIVIWIDGERRQAHNTLI